MKTAIGILIFVAIIANSCVHAAEFYPLGFGVSTNIFGEQLAVSSDGTVLVGRTLDDELVRWTKEDGADVLLSDVVDASISGDGKTIVTSRRISQDVFQATIIRGDVISNLPVDRPSASSRAWLISGDGTTIVGSLDGVHVTWVNESMTEFPIEPEVVSTVRATSRDGSVMVGSAFRWSSTDGLQERPEQRVWGVSETGRWSVGESFDLTLTGRRALRWDGLSAPEEIPGPYDAWGSNALDVTADGGIVVGRLVRPLEEGEAYPVDGVYAGLWTAGSERMMVLQDLLVNQYGIADALDGWTLSGVYDITSDGRHMVGHAYNPNGEEEAFLVDLGIRGDLNGDENLDITDLNELISAIGGGIDDLHFDIDWSGDVDSEDLDYWVHAAKQTYFGDANLDGEFNSGDLVDIFTVGKYETAEEAGWSEGDWNADGVFGSGDLVLAFQDGGYEQGPPSATQAVPEPSTTTLVVVSLVTFILGRRMSI